jgi:competence protein ComEA
MQGQYTLEPIWSLNKIPFSLKFHNNPLVFFQNKSCLVCDNKNILDTLKLRGKNMKKLLLLLSLWTINAFATPVNVNTADAKTISEALSGIGLKKAEAIVKYRTDNGLFKTANDLANVKGIGEKTVEKNKNDILLTDAAAVNVEPKKENKSK